MNFANAPLHADVALPVETGPLVDGEGLRRHTLIVRNDLEKLKLPAADWIPPSSPASGEPVLDILIIGAGMYGIAAAAALKMKGIGNIRIIDRAERGSEGPWMTFARMPTLRSPKDLPGPALGLASLTFRAWYEACYGEAGFRDLYKVPNHQWRNYLSWLQGVLDLPIVHRCEAIGLIPSCSMVKVALADGRHMSARRVVVATGRIGTGGPAIPGFVDRAIFPALGAHTSDMIDFSALAGKELAVIGAGASAWDNAATALEAGAAKVTIYARREFLPQINKGKPASHAGFLHGWVHLEPAKKWSLACYFDQIQSPPPHETIHRTMHQSGFALKLGCHISSIRSRDGKAALTINGESHQADFVIVGTGFNVDLTKEPLFADFAEDIALWKHRYEPPDYLVRPHLSRFPWLGPGFELEEREPSEASALSRIHLFNHAAALSHGQVASDVPGLSVGAERLSGHIAKRFFAEDFHGILDNLKAWGEHELMGTSLHIPVDPATLERI